MVEFENLRSEKMNEIKGTTKIVGVIGYPVSHSLSPKMHNAVFRKMGLDWIYIAFPVAPPNLKYAIKGLAGLGIEGVNVTIPHKEAVIKYLDEISEEARLIGAVNTILVKKDGKLFGTNTDAPGFRTAIEKDGGFKIGGKRVTIFGAGGVAKAISVACALSDAQSITITDIQFEKCELIMKSVKKANSKTKVSAFKPGTVELRNEVQKSDLIVDATPLGMKPGDPSPCPADWLPKNAFVFDTVYNSPLTPILRDAKERGLKTQNGLPMLIYQGAISFEIWTGIKPDIEVMREVLLKV